jgi:hypothetical protein
MSLDQQQVRQMALVMPEATESQHQGTPDFRVRGKIFVTLSPDGGRAVLKMTPADLDLFVHNDPEIFRDVWGGRWMSVDLEKVNPDLFGRLMVDAWCLAAPKKLVKAYREASSS